MRLRNGSVTVNKNDNQQNNKKNHKKTKENGENTQKNNRNFFRPVYLFKLVLTVILTLYFAIPALVKVYPFIQTKIVFLNNIYWPPFIDLQKPETFGLPAARNFYISSDSDIRLGVWHILPKSLWKDAENQSEKYYTNALGDERPVILYLHGNAGTRGGWHRVQLYKVLSSLDYHVIAVDYRGYGDSDGYPGNEDDVIRDVLSMYRWLHHRISNVYIWGHSLGSGIATRLAKRLCESGSPPIGLVLESPFNNLHEAAKSHPLCTPYKYFPMFDQLFEYIFVESLKHNEIHFASDQNILSVTSPVLILHAKDDRIVPFELGEKLYKATQASKNDDVEFIAFEGSHGYGHKHIHRAPSLPDIIRKFVKKCANA